MKSDLRSRRRAGFTLVEMMVVAAIVALVAVIAVPNWLRARKRSQASAVLEDLRLIDESIDQYAVERNSRHGDTLDWDAIRAYLKTTTRLESSGGMDILGNSFGSIFTVDTIPRVPGATFNALSDTAPSDYWLPYY